MVKIIALLPFKNEAWVLPSYLSSVSKIADEIIALDDNSIDRSASVLQSAGATVITKDFGSEKVVNMSARRQVLLDAGRAAGGTHFIWLDADETFSSNFISVARKVIATLKPGQKMTMRWVHPWKNTVDYLDDTRSPFGRIWKDFIVCDDPSATFTDQFLSEARTPGPWGEPLMVSETDGVVLHWQFADWEAMQWKQAWYRCTELIESSRSARRINHTYSITLDNPGLQVSTITQTWLKNITLPTLPSNKVIIYRQMLDAYFTQYGISFFEPLQIWHIEELKKIFIEKFEREPKSKTYPAIVILLNGLKNKLK
jgi:glycosyltransferase involved in cell wall biosynthesis